MRKTTILLFCIIASISINVVNGQGDNDSSVSYDRNAVSVLLLDHGGEYMNDLKKASAGMIIPSKYDDNLLSTRYIKAKSNPEIIKSILQQNKIPNNIIEKWFARDNSGKFSVELIHERGMYNATDDDVVQASGSKIGIAQLKDAGEMLIAHSYILILEIDDIKTMEEQYQKQDLVKAAAAKLMDKEYSPVKRRRNGWVGDVKAYLYRMNFNDSIMNIFYNDLWIYDDDDEATIAAKKARFDEMEFPISFIMEIDGGRGDGSQYNSDEVLAPPVQLTRDELFQKMINTGMNSILYKIESKVEEFKVKTPLYGVHPLRAKAGKKEGLMADQRYFALEFEQNKKGETVAVRKGVVRTKKVVNNEKVATGDSKLYSTFYQIAGHSLSEGMLLSQRNDFGFNILGGMSLGQIGGGFIKAEANVAVLASRYLGMNLGMNQVKLYVEGGFQNKEYDLSSYIGFKNNENVSFSRIHFGISKGWYFANNFSFAPFVGYGFETASNGWTLVDNGVESLHTDLMDFGATFTMNIRYWLQVVAIFNYYKPISLYDQDGNIPTHINKSYSNFFEDREGTSINLGLRIEF